MKRYRVLSFDFDSRATLLGTEIKEDWDESIKESHSKSKEQIIQGLVAEYGRFRSEIKLRNFMAIGAKPWSIIAFHNRFAAQARSAFVIEAYYPALTGACALGERILNHLLLLLRGYYKATPEYKKVYQKSAFDDWNLAIDTLESWGVLLKEVAKDYRKLGRLRNRVLHFSPPTDHDTRELALNAIKGLDAIIDGQFASLGLQPWFIPGTPGASFIRREAESVPFVREVYLPNCHLVGPHHRLEIVNGRFVVHDDEVYETKDISDEEYVKLLA